MRSEGQDDTKVAHAHDGLAGLEARRNPDKLFKRSNGLHNYIVRQLRLGLDPGHERTLKSHRLDIVAHHQQVLEHTQDESLERMEGVATWLDLNGD